MTGGWKWSKKKDKMGRAKGITKEQTVTGFYTYIKLILQILGSMSVRSTPNPKKAKHTTYKLLVSIIFWGLRKICKSTKHFCTILPHFMYIFNLMDGHIEFRFVPVYFHIYLPYFFYLFLSLIQFFLGL